MMQRVVILSVGNFGRETLDVFIVVNQVTLTFVVLGFLDNNQEKPSPVLNG